MMRLALSPAALGLLRALTARAAVPSHQVVVREWRSTDWHSLTFAGERHEIRLRISGPGAGEACSRLLDHLSDAEFSIPGHIVADVEVLGRKDEGAGSIELTLEALTIAE